MYILRANVVYLAGSNFPVFVDDATRFDAAAAGKCLSRRPHIELARYGTFWGASNPPHQISNLVVDYLDLVLKSSHIQF